MTPIRIHNVSKRFGSTIAVDNVTLDIGPGELFFLLGPSGCGKTTLLRMLAGFVRPDSGDIHFGDQRINDLPPKDRDAGMVFQTYALWPHMSVARNVAYGLHVRGQKRAEVNRRVDRVLKMVRMEGFGERRPNQLSGGQQQRVALARALVIEPRVLLLDEPLSNLDARLRDELREEIRRLHAETGLTMVYVTHDQKEAMSLADRLAVIDRGRLVQAGGPAEIYNRPANRFVAGFLGDCNFLPGTVRDTVDGTCTIDTAPATLAGMSVGKKPGRGANVLCAIRPHALTIDTVTTANRIPAQVREVTYLGDVVHVQLVAMGDTKLQMVCLPQTGQRLRAGENVSLGVPVEQVIVMEDTQPS
jgi:iron(III) transport system ATP-binding protein